MRLMAVGWDRVELGRSGVQVTPLGLGSSFGVGASDMERAFERGINYFYWGSRRTPEFGEGMSAIARKHREGMVAVIQTYAREAAKVRPALESGLASLSGVDYADFLLLGAWDQPPPADIMDAALGCKEAGLARHLMISCHHRPTFETYVNDPRVDAIMVRYNAAHVGAERDVFPRLGAAPPGVVAYTTTRWGDLMRPELTPEGEVTPRASDCYRFALSSPHVDLCLSGPKDGAELDEAMAALDRGPMDADEIAWIRRVGKSMYPLSPERLEALAAMRGDAIPYE
jgi:aryl-alcohol dehydrogenase-like predicted oxidoreductase